MRHFLKFSIDFWIFFFDHILNYLRKQIRKLFCVVFWYHNAQRKIWRWFFSTWPTNIKQAPPHIKKWLLKCNINYTCTTIGVAGFLIGGGHTINHISEDNKIFSVRFRIFDWRRGGAKFSWRPTKDWEGANQNVKTKTKTQQIKVFVDWRAEFVPKIRWKPKNL